jgi:hypothetical protein
VRESSTTDMTDASETSRKAMLALESEVGKVEQAWSVFWGGAGGEREQIVYRGENRAWLQLHPCSAAVSSTGAPESGSSPPRCQQAGC